MDRWRLFPREILFDLSRFHRRRVSEWHSGEMSSFELLGLLDGLMLDERSWYRHSVADFLKEMEEQQEDSIVEGVRSTIFAQLHGQKVKGADDG